MRYPSAGNPVILRETEKKSCRLEHRHNLKNSLKQNTTRNSNIRSASQELRSHATFCYCIQKPEVYPHTKPDKSSPNLNTNKYLQLCVRFSFSILFKLIKNKNALKTLMFKLLCELIYE
jgi:hypothetical protein